MSSVVACIVVPTAPVLVSGVFMKLPTISATDNSKVKALAFEYLDNKGNPAIIPKESVTYV